jgi:hypothetical protein
VLNVLSFKCRFPYQKAFHGLLILGNMQINWAAKIEIYLIGVSLKSIQSHGFRFGKSGISIGDIPSIFA